MERTHDGRHGDGCFGCRIQSVHFDPAAMPTRRNENPSRAFSNNSWERGIAVHPSGMPYLDGSLDTIPLHEWSSKRSTYEREFNAQTAAGQAASEKG